MPGRTISNRLYMNGNQHMQNRIGIGVLHVLYVNRSSNYSKLY